MKKMTIEEFTALTARTDWNYSQDIDTIENMMRPEYVWDSEFDCEDSVEISHVWGVAVKISTLDDITIIYTEGFNFDEGNVDSFSAGTEGQDDIWKVEGVTVINEYDEVLTAHDLWNLDCFKNAYFDEIDYSNLKKTI